MNTNKKLPRRAQRIASEPQPVDQVTRTLVIQLVATALAAGSPIPQALIAVGNGMSNAEGRSLASVGRALLLGARWDNAWELGPHRLIPLKHALAHSWEYGAPAAHTLAAAAENAEKDAVAHSRAASQKLAVLLVLPLGLCYLPSFVLLGVVPLIVQLAGPLLK